MPKKTKTSDGQTTPTFGIHYPAQESKVDIAGDFEQLALSVEDALDNLEVDGTPGADGKSAYEIALEKDPSVGTEEEWLESLKGDTGPKGEDGNNGKDGDPGNDGVSATVTVDSDVITGAPDTSADVENTSDDPHNAVFKFTIPRGSKGEKGDDGNDGKDGSGVTILGRKTWAEIQAVADKNEGDMYILAEDEASAPSPVDAGGSAGDGIVWIDGDWSNVGPIQGPKGDDGTAAKITVIGTNTLEADKEASVDQTGDDADTKLTFNIPKGEDGKEGAPGDDGVSPTVTVAGTETIEATEDAEVIATEGPDVELTFKIPKGKDGADAQFPDGGKENEVLVKGDGDSHDWKPLVTYEDLSAIGGTV